MASPTASSRLTVRIGIAELTRQAAHQLGLPNKTEPTQHMIIEAKKQLSAFIKLFSLNCGQPSSVGRLFSTRCSQLTSRTPSLVSPHSSFVPNRLFPLQPTTDLTVKTMQPLCSASGIVYADIKHIETKKLAIRNEPHKVTGIWQRRTTHEVNISSPFADQHCDPPRFRATTSTRQDIHLPPDEQQFEFFLISQTFPWAVDRPLFDINHLPSVTDNDLTGESNAQLSTTASTEHFHQTTAFTSTTATDQRFCMQPAAPLRRPTASPTSVQPTSSSRPSASTTAPPSPQPPPGIHLPQQLPGDHLHPPALTQQLHLHQLFLRHPSCSITTDSSTSNPTSQSTSCHQNG